MSTIPSTIAIDAMVATLHGSDWMAYIATTGAAGGLREDLWRAPKSSNTIIGMQFLYDQRELAEFIRYEPKQYCSQETALRMAAAAYSKGQRRVIERGEAQRPVIGVGMTAAVNRGPANPMKGDHRVHIATKTAQGLRTVSATFDKSMTREAEGRACDLLTLAALLQVTIGSLYIDRAGVTCGEFAQLYEDRASVMPREFRHRPPAGLAPGENTDIYLFGADRLDPAKHLIYPGSFAPLHFGHEQVAEMAEAMTGMKVVFQLTASHPAKGRVPEEEMKKRLAQFAFRSPTLVLETEGLYIEKARALPGFGFLIGADAVYGLLDEKYYGGKTGLRETLDEFERLGTRFYVVGRTIGGIYTALEDIAIPDRHRRLFQAVSGRWDISSTQLRGK